MVVGRSLPTVARAIPRGRPCLGAHPISEDSWCARTLPGGDGVGGGVARSWCCPSSTDDPVRPLDTHWKRWPRQPAPALFVHVRGCSVLVRDTGFEGICSGFDSTPRRRALAGAESSSTRGSEGPGLAGRVFGAPTIRGPGVSLSHVYRTRRAIRARVQARPCRSQGCWLGGREGTRTPDLSRVKRAL